MRIRALGILLMTGIMFALTGCGGGGGGGGGGTTSSTVISGVASKGLLNGATVNFYGVDSNGNKLATPLTTTPSVIKTNSDGTYSATISNYSGSVVVEVTGGSYTDEATQQPVTLTTPLRSAFNVPAGSSTAISAVTPLTEIAVEKMASFTTANVSAANILVSNLMFGGKNIVTVLPTDVSNPGSASDDQKSYALILAAVAQKMKDDKAALGTVLTALANNVNANNQTLQNPSLITTPLNQYLTTSTTNQTGINSVTATNLVKIVTKAIVKLSIANLPAGTTVATVDLSLTLPAGVTPATLNGTDASGSAVLSNANSLSGAGFDPITGVIHFGSINLGGFSAGEFLTINCLATPNAMVNSTGFTLTAQLTDAQGLAITGATVTPVVIFQ